MRRIFPFLVALSLFVTSCAISTSSATGKWIRRASMQAERSWIGMTSVDGKVYAIGGMFGGEGHRVDSNEVYDPQTDSWKYLAALPTARSSLGIAAVGTTIYAIGGFATEGVSDRVEAYDILTNRWITDLPPMPTKRFDLTTVALDNVIYAIGGFDRADMNIVEAFDTVSKKWTPLPSLPTSRYALQSVVMDGMIYVLGGRSKNVETDVVEVFDPKTQTWSVKTKMPEPIAAFGVVVAEGILHVVKYNKHFAYDPRTNKWQSSLPAMPTSRHGLQLAYVDGIIYAVGGCSPGGGNLFDVARNEAFVLSAPNH